MPDRGRLIALEGIDGCGKSTQARALAEALGARLTFEPGATPVGARLRQLLLAPDAPPPSPRAEALLMAADRAEHVALVLEPALAAGEWVVSDRYAGSTIAYQGYGRGLDPAALGELVGWATGGLAADLSVLVDVERRGRGGAPGRRGPGRRRPDGAPGAGVRGAGAPGVPGPGGGGPRALGRRGRRGGQRDGGGAYRGLRARPAG